MVTRVQRGTTEAPEWKELVNRRGYLRMLEAKATTFPRVLGNDYCRYDVWYGTNDREGIRNILTEQVGWCSIAKDPFLHTTEAYDIAYDHLYDLLPPCTREYCGCEVDEAEPPVTKQRKRPTLVEKRPPSSLRREFEGIKPLVTPAVLELAGYRCRFCGSGRKLTIDHIVPLEKMGTNDIRNLGALCGSCNSRKGAR